LFVTIFLFNLAVIFAMLIPVIILALAIDQESKFLVIFSAVVVIVEALAFMSYSGMLMAHFYESVIDEGNGGAEPIAERTTATINSADFEEK
jgi:NO-binding membrane sensor protein with MHYT domain